MSMGLGLGLGLLCRGRGAAWTPAKLFAGSEAGGWYDPSDLSTVWQDSARTTAGAVDSPVGALDDKSGNGNHLLQASATLRPILRQSGSLYYLERDGSDDAMATDANLTLQAGWTLAAAGSFSAGADTTTASLMALEVSSTDYFILGFRQSIAEARAAVRGASTSPAVALTTAQGGTNSLVADTAAVMVSQFQALSYDLRVDGTNLDTEATTWDAQTLAGARLAFGRYGVTTVVPANLYAAVALQRIPSAGELASLEAWLAGKAGVAL